MNKNHKTRILLIACIIIVCTLSLIQYYLVRNTYLLTKDNYYTEVKKEMTRITNEPVVYSLGQEADDNLRQTINLYSKRKMSKSDFFKTLKNSNADINNKSNTYFSKRLNTNPRLRGVRYKSQLEEIRYEKKGKSDTLLIAPEKPFIFIGRDFQTASTILLNKNITVTSFYDLRLSFIQSNYIDVSSWKKEVFKRMAGTLFLAIGLIIAVTTLFYLIFSAMIRQKKLAEIKTDFANNITHELKTPLSSVSIILKSALRQEVLTNPEVLENLLTSLDRQHEKIRKLIDSVLDSTMIANTKIELKEQDINSFLHEYFKDLAIGNHTILYEIDQQQQVVITNTILLEKILNILIDNAAKYSEEGKAIRVKTLITSHHYNIEISDQGPGIAEEYQHEIFDKFYRVPERNKHTVKGLGLGLYLGKQAAIQIGAQLIVRSKQGHGSTFIIRLPV
jgi:signal transduction histidine kinase